MEVTFKVPGDPHGKQRPRTVRSSTGRTTTYTPEQTVLYENLVKFSYLHQCPGVFLQGPIEASITAYFAIPKSTSKKRSLLMQQGKILHTTKIDCDNLAKAVLDSLNKIAYQDDAQIARLTVEKRYGLTPYIEVTLKEIDEHEKDRQV